MKTAPSKASDLLAGAALTAAISLIWVLFTTDILCLWAPWPMRDVSWWQMVHALGG